MSYQPTPTTPPPNTCSGNWLTCRELGSNRDGTMGSLERSSRFTSQFLPYSPKNIWVEQLEDVDTVVAHSWWVRRGSEEMPATVYVLTSLL